MNTVETTQFKENTPWLMHLLLSVGLSNPHSFILALIEHLLPARPCAKWWGSKGKRGTRTQDGISSYPHLQEAQSHSTWWPYENWWGVKAPWAQNDTSWGSDVPERNTSFCWDTTAKSQSSALKISGSPTFTHIRITWRACENRTRALIPRFLMQEVWGWAKSLEF